MNHPYEPGKPAITILGEIFNAGWACFAGDLNRIMGLLAEGRLGSYPWHRYVEGQFDLVMARGYEHLGEKDKRELIPIGYLRYDYTTPGNQKRGDLCFAESCTSGQDLYAMGETKFIRDSSRSDNEQCLLGDIKKLCLEQETPKGLRYMIWLFAGNPEQFLPQESPVMKFCGWCRQSPAVSTDLRIDCRTVRLAGVEATMTVSRRDVDAPPEYKGYFIWHVQ